MNKRHIIKLSSSLLFLLVVLLASCNTQVDDFEGQNQNDEFTYHSQLQISTPRQPTTRSSETSELESLRLLVFDEENRFLYSRSAVLGGFNSDNQSFDYPVRLISSTKKRFIHFIANHDWDGFEQDYFLEGLDAGYLIGSLITKNSAYWSVSELESLNEGSLQGINTKMMSNQAQIRVESSAQEFQLEGFKIYNAYDRATVASFEVDERGQVNFSKDLNAIIPTVPSEAKLKTDEDFQVTARKVFERFTANEQPLFVLIKGTYNGVENNYYKIDLKRDDSQIGVTKLYDILRNHSYNIRIRRVVGSGHDTEEKAVKAPAGNNVFASIELENYNAVSNGRHELVIGRLAQIIVRHPFTFETSVQYSEGLQNVQYLPSWDESDPYLEALDESELSQGIIRVRTKQIPADRRINHTIDIVASSDGQGTDIMTRQVRLILEAPYNFNAYCVEEDNREISVSFILSKSLDDSVFPLDVFIKANKLTPIPSKNEPNMLLVYENGEYIYKFTYRRPPEDINQKLYFRRSNMGEDDIGAITLSGFYFSDAELKI